jgi:predicted O-methyltransferase YrrM
MTAMAQPTATIRSFFRRLWSLPGSDGAMGPFGRSIGQAPRYVTRLFTVSPPIVSEATGSRLDLRWMKRCGWLGTHLVDTIPAAPRKRDVEAAASATDKLGAQRLASEYGEAGGVRTPDTVRSSSQSGDLYAWLVQQRAPDRVVEFGSAFGVSGMYFASGLETARHGHLYSFEINRQWAQIAERNIRSISDRVTLTRGAFEDHVAAVVPGTIDIAFVDGIHTYRFVMRQFEVLRPRMTAGGIIIVDDIDFARPDARMAEAWHEIASNIDVVGAVEIGGHVGVVELT